MKKRRIVISGSPGGGKTTLINALEGFGYAVYNEFSRSIIEKGFKEGKGRYFLTDPESFSEALFLGRKKQFEDFETQKSNFPHVFYDRGVPDIYAYLEAHGKASSRWAKITAPFQYDFVFLVTPWKAIYKKDEARMETFEEAAHYFSFIESVYTKKHPVFYLPEDTVEARLAYIAAKLKQHG